jgi:glycine cleavage system H protein
MSAIRDDLRYTKSHEWVRVLDDGSIEAGITDHAQHALGDVVYVETPQVGRRVGAREPFAVVESVKAASDVYSPLAGEITAVNPELAEAPERINHDPYGAGWIARLHPDDARAAAGLMSAAQYASWLATEGA